MGRSTPRSSEAPWHPRSQRGTAGCGSARALRAIHDEPDVAVQCLRALIPYLTPTQAREHHERHVAPYFTTDGRHDPVVAARTLSAIAEELAAPHDA